MKIRRRLLPFLLSFCLSPVPGIPRDLNAQAAPVLIAEVRFEGNSGISESRLRRLLHVSLEGSEYVPQNLNADLQRVKNAYQDEGFMHVKVGPPDVRIEARGAEKFAVIRIPVKEGTRYTAGEVAVKNVQALDPASLLQLCPLQKGQAYSRIKVSRWQAQVEESYRSMGYIRIRCVPREQVSEIRNVVDASLECVEGKPYSVGKITLVADESIDRVQFKRRLLLSEGGVFNPEMLTLTLQFLNQMRLYRPISNSDVEIDIDDAKGIVNLTWHLFLPES